MTALGVEWGIEAAVVAVAATLGFRILLKAPVRREAGSHPWITLAAGALALAGLVVAASIAASSDTGRRALVSLVAAGTLAAIVRAHPTWGRRRGLPPGSLGLAVSLDAVDDPRFYADAARRWGPVFKIAQIHQPVACVTDPTVIHDLLQRDDGALAQSDWSFNRLVPGGYLEYMDGEAHRRYRGLFAPAFTPDVVDGARDVVADAARAQLAAMARDASAPTAAGGGVHPEAYLLPVPQRALLAMVLGIDAGHPRFDDIGARFADLNRPMELFLPAPRSSQETYGWLVEAVEDHARRLRGGAAPTGRATGGEGGAVAPPSVLGNLVAEAPETVDDDTAMGNLVLMVKEGTIMVRGLLRWILKMLGDHPEWTIRLRENAADPAALENLATAFARETIRLYESRYLYRRVVRPVEVGGYTIPAGWLLRLCLGEAHEDPHTFDDPQRFDPDRFLRSPPSEERFCPFGHGPHACLGAGPALTIAAVMAREAARRYDLRIVDDGPAWRINRHWGLWRPSSRLRLALDPVNDSDPVARPNGGVLG